MPMRKALIYSVLFHIAVVLLAGIEVPLGLYDPVEDYDVIEVEIAEFSETPEFRAPTPEPKPAPKAEAKPEPEPKPEPKPEPQPEPEQVAALPPQPEPIPEPQPEPEPDVAQEQEKPSLPMVPRAKPVPPKKDDFDMMLKDLSEQLDQDKPKEEPEKKEETDVLDDIAAALDKPEPETEPLHEKAYKAPRLGTRLTVSEEDLVRKQIERCWNVPVGARNPEELVVVVRVWMNRDRTVRDAKVVDVDRMARDRFYRAMAESALRAVLNPKCSPLKLPVNKYDHWRQFEFAFDPSKMVGRS